MKKYNVYLKGWCSADLETAIVIEAENASKAKGIYIKRCLKGFLNGYSKSMFFQCLRCKIKR